MTHSIECEKLFKQWEKKYPNHCKTCNGAGGVSYSGNYWNPPDFAECDNCIGQGKCPLCGEDFPEDFEFGNNLLPCGHDYWNLDTPQCICEGTPICDNDKHLMKYRETIWIDNFYEVEIFVCPECGEEKRW